MTILGCLARLLFPKRFTVIAPGLELTEVSEEDDWHPPRLLNFLNCNMVSCSLAGMDSVV
jgi:hypothetical protein